MNVANAIQGTSEHYLADHDHTGSTRSEFQPAFLNKRTGQVELSRWGNGTPASIHLIRFLPSGWADKHDRSGMVEKLMPEIVAGFARDGVFYTRAEAAEL